MVLVVTALVTSAGGSDDNCDNNFDSGGVYDYFYYDSTDYNDADDNYQCYYNILRFTFRQQFLLSLP